MMDAFNLVAALIAVGLVAYLVYALFCAEDF